MVIGAVQPTEEVAEVAAGVRALPQPGVQFVRRGAGRGPSSGTLPQPDGVVIGGAVAARAHRPPREASGAAGEGQVLPCGRSLTPCGRHPAKLLDAAIPGVEPRPRGPARPSTPILEGNPG